jgi:hypothetical protein
VRPERALNMADVLQLKRKAAPEAPAHHQLADKMAAEANCPHGAGEMFCMACNHTWAGVAPIGATEAFTCPSCGTHRGRWKFEFTPPETTIWTCNCGNQLFNITPKGTFCPGCGDYMRF